MQTRPITPIVAEPASQAKKNELKGDIKNLIYRCEFEKVLHTIANTPKASLADEDYVELQLLYSTSLYETLATEDAKFHLRTLTSSHKFQCRASYHYTLGKLSYFDGDYEQAKIYFNSIQHLTSDATLKFRGILGIANVHYSTSNDSQLPQVIAELDLLKDFVGPEDQISFLILLGNVYRSLGPDKVLAKKYYHQALSLAASKTWTYFIQRAIYGLACCALAEQNASELAVYLKILNSFIEKSESALFRKLVQEKFYSKSKNSGFEVDQRTLTITASKVCLNLNDSPLVFQFIKILNFQYDFLDKKKISSQLWPSERYMPHTHDARIFDIAKRVRKMLSKHFNDSTSLLSNRLGYKLVNEKNN